MFKNHDVLEFKQGLLDKAFEEPEHVNISQVTKSEITWNESAVCESGNENVNGGEVFPSCCPFPFHET